MFGECGKIYQIRSLIMSYNSFNYLTSDIRLKISEIYLKVIDC